MSAQLPELVIPTWRGEAEHMFDALGLTDFPKRRTLPGSTAIGMTFVCPPVSLAQDVQYKVIRLRPQGPSMAPAANGGGRIRAAVP